MSSSRKEKTLRHNMHWSKILHAMSYFKKLKCGFMQKCYQESGPVHWNPIYVTGQSLRIYLIFIRWTRVNFLSEEAKPDLFLICICTIKWSSLISVSKSVLKKQSITASMKVAVVQSCTASLCSSEVYHGNSSKCCSSSAAQGKPMRANLLLPRVLF